MLLVSSIHQSDSAMHISADFFLLCAVLCLVAQLSLTLCNPMESARLLCLWGSPGKNTGMGCHALLQGIFPTQVSCIAGGFFTTETPGKPIFPYKLLQNVEYSFLCYTGLSCIYVNPKLLI